MIKLRTPMPDAACAEKLRVLSDPTRLSVVELLMAGPRHVGQMNEVLELDQSLLSHHLRVLREAGLVTAQRDGKAVLYSLAPGVADSKEAGPGTINLTCCKLSFN